jgi:ribosomal protein S12 methylthiotransferase
MGRRIGRKDTEALLEKLRDRIPGVSIRTTMMAGFPGESGDEFAELLAFVRDFKFDALGVFAYSAEPDTPAGRLEEQVPEEVKQERVDSLMAAQQEVAFELADRRKGREFEVLVEGPEVDGLIPARHAGQAPEVDSVTWLETEQPHAESVAAGRFVAVCCTGRREYDLLVVPKPVAVVATA